MTEQLLKLADSWDQQAAELMHGLPLQPNPEQKAIVAMKVETLVACAKELRTLIPPRM